MINRTFVERCGVCGDSEETKPLTRRLGDSSGVTAVIKTERHCGCIFLFLTVAAVRSHRSSCCCCGCNKSSPYGMASDVFTRVALCISALSTVLKVLLPSLNLQRRNLSWAQITKTWNICCCGFLVSRSDSSPRGWSSCCAAASAGCGTVW